MSAVRAGDDQFREWFHQKIRKENILRQNVHGDLAPIVSADQKLMKTVSALPVLGELFEEMGGYANNVGYLLFDDPIEAWHRAKDYYVKVVGRNSAQYTLLDNALRLILGKTVAAIVLEPEEKYENHGFKSGVVYACGAVIKNGTLFVYYGGADTFVAVATAPLREFMEQLITSGKVTMTSKKFK